MNNNEQLFQLLKETKNRYINNQQLLDFLNAYISCYMITIDKSSVENISLGSTKLCGIIELRDFLMTEEEKENNEITEMQEDLNKL